MPVSAGRVSVSSSSRSSYGSTYGYNNYGSSSYKSTASSYKPHNTSSNHESSKSSYNLENKSKISNNNYSTPIYTSINSSTNPNSWWQPWTWYSVSRPSKSGSITLNCHEFTKCLKTHDKPYFRDKYDKYHLCSITD